MKAVSPVSKEEVEENIREVADAILDYCASPVEGKPAAVKQVGCGRRVVTWSFSRFKGFAFNTNVIFC